jgi:hypothetical protein
MKVFVIIGSSVVALFMVLVVAIYAGNVPMAPPQRQPSSPPRQQIDPEDYAKRINADYRWKEVATHLIQARGYRCPFVESYHFENPGTYKHVVRVYCRDAPSYLIPGTIDSRWYVKPQ